MSSLRRLVLPLAILAMLAGCYSAAEPWRDLVADHVTTTGHIVYVDCGSHGLVVYAFSAGGQEYRGKVAREILRCQDAKLGDPILVYYSPTLPGLHTSRTPAAQFAAEQGWYMPAAGWIALLGAWIIGGSVAVPLWRRRRARDATA